MDESTLQERVILKLKSKGWNLLAREYYVFPKMQHLGKGDLRTSICLLSRLNILICWRQVVQLGVDGHKNEST